MATATKRRKYQFASRELAENAYRERDCEVWRLNRAIRAVLLGQIDYETKVGAFDAKIVNVGCAAGPAVIVLDNSASPQPSMTVHCFYTWHAAQREYRSHFCHPTACDLWDLASNCHQFCANWERVRNS